MPINTLTALICEVFTMNRILFDRGIASGMSNMKSVGGTKGFINKNEVF